MQGKNFAPFFNMQVITTGSNTLRFNASGEVLYNDYILEIIADAANYSVDVTLGAPVVDNSRYMSFTVTQTTNPDITDAEFELPNAGRYRYNVYNTNSTKAAGIIIFSGIFKLDTTRVTNKVYVNTKTNKVWE